MKRLAVLAVGLVLAGCATTPMGPALTSDEARDKAVQLANDKASSFYHCRPFTNTGDVTSKHGRWYWTQTHGQGKGDMQAKVEMTADGRPIIVDVQMTTGMMIPQRDF